MTGILNTTTSSLNHYTSSYAIPGGNNTVLTYHSVNQLYYSAFDKNSGSIIDSSSFDNYIESSFTSASRFLNSSGVVYSLPRNKIGTHIEPNTFRLGTEDEYVINQDSYVVTDYLFKSEGIIDDGEGNLIIPGTGENVGNIIYSHGQAIITDPELTQYYLTEPGQDISWKSNQPIYTYNYNIKISDYEYNFTLNPTAQTGSDGQLADNVTGSYFQPYITTVGLYNDSNELIAVAKLAQPLPKSANTEMTIQVKLDI